MARAETLNFRHLDVTRARSDDLDTSFQTAVGLSQQQVAYATASLYCRVARLEGQVIGAYSMREPYPAESLFAGGSTDPAALAAFHLQWVGVRTDFRRRGLGGWLVGHAIGVAETKGAQCLDVSFAEQGDHVAVAGALFVALGFVQREAAAGQLGFRYQLIPE